MASDMRRHDHRPANLAAYARLFERWSASRHRETVQIHQLGFLEQREGLRGEPGLPALPLLQFFVEPGGSIDFAHRSTGFHGLAHRPPRERVLRLWTDQLISVNHGLDWIFVIDTSTPFNRSWLDLLVPPGSGPSEPLYAAVSASFAGPTPTGAFRVADLDATTHLSLVRVSDHRNDLDRQCRAASRIAREHLRSRTLDRPRQASNGEDPPHTVRT